MEERYEKFTKELNVDRDSVKRQVKQEENTFDDDYSGKEELRAKLFFALETVSERTH